MRSCEKSVNDTIRPLHSGSEVASLATCKYTSWSTVVKSISMLYLDSLVAEH